MRLWDSVKAAAAGVEDDGSFDSPSGPEDCEARRAAAFRVTSENLALPDDWGDRPFGVIVEVGSDKGATTIVAFASGESSFLGSTGSGIIGRPSHVHVVVQAKRLVERAAEHVSSLSPTAIFPRPAAGAIRFYVLTRQGVLTAEAPAQTVRSGDSPLSPLLEVADDLMSEFLQYGLTRDVTVGPPKALALLKAFAMVAVIGALTYAAWLIPMAWLRWPAVAIGVFLTISALIVPYAMLVAPRLSGHQSDGTTPAG